MINKIKCCLLVLLPGLFTQATGQEFKVKALLDAVPATGFYRIAINPDLTALANANLSDIRIAGSDGSYVPYIIQSKAPGMEPKSAAGNSLTMLSNTTERNLTTIILESPASAPITGISLILNASSVERWAQVSGSNDNKQWFIIDDHVLLQKADGNKIGQYSQNIYFPGNNYRYFKLRINNAHTDPLNVVGATAIARSEKKVALPENITNPTPSISQKDSSNHISYVTLRNAAPYLVNEVTLTVSGAKLYERDMVIYVLPSDKDSAALEYPVTTATLSSARPATFIIPGQKCQSILLVIDNKDNPPLKVTQATTQQIQQYLVSWLTQGEKYSLIAGKADAPTPQYDLSKFTDSIPQQLPVLAYGTFNEIARAAPAATKPKPNSYILWIVIVASAIILSGLTYKLMKDIKKSE